MNSNPWETEPDSLEFEAHGFSCAMQRNELTGAWCGYVHLPEGHPFYGKDYNEIDIKAHGGLTFGDFREPGKWWVGFDCCHYDDYAPTMEEYYARQNTLDHIELMDLTEELYQQQRQLADRLKGANFEKVYRDLEWVKEETSNIARQLAEVKA